MTTTIRRSRLALLALAALAALVLVAAAAPAAAAAASSSSPADALDASLLEVEVDAHAAQWLMQQAVHAAGAQIQADAPKKVSAACTDRQPDRQTACGGHSGEEESRSRVDHSLM